MESKTSQFEVVTDAPNAGKGDEPLDIARLAASGLVGRVEYHASLASTQDRAHEVARQQDCGPLPLLIVAEEQTAGRGRGSNRWWTGGGSLAFSLLVDPAGWNLARQPLPLRSMAVGVAIVDALRPLLSSHAVGLHWPNDVFANDRKISGILIDVLQGGRHVVGIGVNVNNTLERAPDDVRRRATSLRELLGRPLDRTELLLGILAKVRETLHESTREAATLGERFGELCLQVGHDLTVDLGGRRASGRCAGIDPDGALVLETATGPQRFYSGRLVEAARGS